MTKKVLFFSLIKKSSQSSGGGISRSTNCKEICEYIMSLTEVNRQYDLASTRFCRLDLSIEDSNIHKLLFKSANHRTRAPLLDRQAGTERDNPKLISEGERVMTHCVIKYTQSGDYIYLESGNGSLKILQIVNYLNHYATKFHAHTNTIKDYKFDFEIIVKSNFLNEINNLNRVIEGEVFVDKQILGSSSLAYTNRIEAVRHDIKITITAERTFSIRNALVDIFNKLNGGSSFINKIRVRGKNASNNSVLIDSEIIAKAEFVDVDIIESTGEVQSDSIFTQIVGIATLLL